jgi:hypothetical protein
MMECEDAIVEGLEIAISSGKGEGKGGLALARNRTFHCTHFQVSKI